MISEWSFDHWSQLKYMKILNHSWTPMIKWLRRVPQVQQYHSPNLSSSLCIPVCVMLQTRHTWLAVATWSDEQLGVRTIISTRWRASTSPISKAFSSLLLDCNLALRLSRNDVTFVQSNSWRPCYFHAVKLGNDDDRTQRPGKHHASIWCVCGLWQMVSLFPAYDLAARDRINSIQILNT